MQIPVRSGRLRGRVRPPGSKSIAQRAILLATRRGGTASRMATAYEPRNAEATVSYRVVREHLLTFLEHMAERTDGVGVPPFVERELRRFIFFELPPPTDQDVMRLVVTVK